MSSGSGSGFWGELIFLPRQIRFEAIVGGRGCGWFVVDEVEDGVVACLVYLYVSVALPDGEDVAVFDDFKVSHLSSLPCVIAVGNAAGIKAAVVASPGSFNRHRSSRAVPR